MSGLKYVGADYTEDNNPLDVVTKADLDNTANGLIANAPASRQAVQNVINTAVGNLASQASVNSALNAFVQSNYLTSGNVWTVVVSPGAVGTYTLGYGTATTTAISPGATAASIQSQLSTFSNITSATVAGPTGGPYTVTISANAIFPLTANLAALSTGSVTINESPLIPTSWKDTSIASLTGGKIPSTFIPSKGQGYCQGPYGPTALYQGTTGSAPLRIADWNIGLQSMNFQPMAFMNLLASGINGARPCVEILMSQGSPQSYNQAGNVLIARGVGRNAWNDQQAITVIPTPASTGHAGVAGSGFGPNYNLWLSAWLKDLNAQSVSVAGNSIFSGVAYLIRYQ